MESIDTVVNTLKDAFDFDALVLGTGASQPDGSVTIGDMLAWHDSLEEASDKCRRIDDSFIREYASVATHDVVGQLFAAYPRIVQVISIRLPETST
jgi:hypothetical protein